MARPLTPQWSCGLSHKVLRGERGVRTPRAIKELSSNKLRLIASKYPNFVLILILYRNYKICSEIHELLIICHFSRGKNLTENLKMTWHCGNETDMIGVKTP